MRKGQRAQVQSGRASGSTQLLVGQQATAAPRLGLAVRSQKALLVVMEPGSWAVFPQVPHGWEGAGEPGQCVAWN